MRLSKRFLYLSEIILGTLFLSMTGILSGGNICLNSISPVLYGRNISISMADWTERISNGLIGSMVPLWMIEKDRVALMQDAICELYPTDSLLDAIYAENHPEQSEGATGQSEDDGDALPAAAPVISDQGIVYTPEMLKDYNYFVSQFYAIDSTTYADGLLDADTFYNMDLSMDVTGEEPKILIYHTHSQEAFADSRPGVWQDTVVGLGEILKERLEKDYGVSVLHLTETFDVVDGITDRSTAYTYAEERVRQILSENPSIKVVIDLHRDGVPEGTRLVTNVDGKETAQLMFLNGLCRTTASGPIGYLQNDYLTENLAFSFKLQLKAAQYYPTLMRRIYLRSYQYNLHILPRSLLVECGAQTNTVEEAQNAMPLLADLLYMVLSGK